MLNTRRFTAAAALGLKQDTIRLKKIADTVALFALSPEKSVATGLGAWRSAGAPNCPAKAQRN
jgi:hypothetical protein